MRKLTVTLLTMVLGIALSSHAGMLANQSFEDGMSGWEFYDSDIDAWNTFDNYTGTAITDSSDFAYDGSMSLKIDSADSGTPVEYPVANESLIAVQPGDVWEVDAQYYCPASLTTDERFGVGLFWYKDDLSNPGDYIYSDTKGDYTTVWGPDSENPEGLEETSAWTAISDSDTAPADAQYLGVIMNVAGKGSAVYFDDINVVPEPFSIGLLMMAVGGIFVGRRFLRRLHH